MTILEFKSGEAGLYRVNLTKTTEEKTFLSIQRIASPFIPHWCGLFPQFSTPLSVNLMNKMAKLAHYISPLHVEINTEEEHNLGLRMNGSQLVKVEGFEYENGELAKALIGRNSILTVAIRKCRNLSMDRLFWKGPL